MQDLLRFVQINSPTLARQRDGLGYIRIWVTPPRRLVFWDGAPSSQVQVEKTQCRRLVFWDGAPKYIVP